MSDTDRGGLLAGLGVATAVLLCCALPTLLAAGALGALGGVVSSPWLWAAAGVALATALARAAVRMRSRTSGIQDGSCGRVGRAPPDPFRAARYGGSGNRRRGSRVPRP